VALRAVRTVRFARLVGPGPCCARAVAPARVSRRRGSRWKSWRGQDRRVRAGAGHDRSGEIRVRPVRPSTSLRREIRDGNGGAREMRHQVEMDAARSQKRGFAASSRDRDSFEWSHARRPGQVGAVRFAPGRSARPKVGIRRGRRRQVSAARWGADRRVHAFLGATVSATSRTRGCRPKPSVTTQGRTEEEDDARGRSLARSRMVLSTDAESVLWTSLIKPTTDSAVSIAAMTDPH